MIKDFFENISYRLDNENDLSDIVWAMCYTSPAFKEVFLRFFFPNINISSDIEIEREVAKDDSRPDFVIHNDGELYLIENKIDDHNHHFNQYDKAFEVEPEKFGYIANYLIPQPEPGKTYQIRTWEAFYNLLETVHLEDEQEQAFIDGFRIYLKSVCRIIEFNKPMNIEGIYSLYQFVEILNKLCKREEEHFILDIYNKDRRFNNTYVDHSVAGINFELKLKDSDFQAWGWIGIYFNEEIPTICMGFNDTENWGKPVCDLIRNTRSEKEEGQLCTAPYLEDGAYWFNFVDGKETYEECFNKLALNEQIDQIKAFMDEVLNLIYGLFVESQTK